MAGGITDTGEPYSPFVSFQHAGVISQSLFEYLKHTIAGLKQPLLLKHTVTNT